MATARRVDPETIKVSRTLPLVTSILIGFASAAFVFLVFRDSTGSGDFWRPFMGAKALADGTTPYEWFGGSRFPGEFPDLYPLVASVWLMPLLPFSFAVAAATFSGISAAFLAYAFASTGYHRLAGFLSFPLIVAIHSSQLSVLITAAFLMPALSFIYIGKPSIGLALLAARWSRRALLFAVAGGGILLAVSLILSPAWPAEWIEVVRANSGHMKLPIAHPGGIIALFALLRWRRPEARLIAALSLVPQNIAWYDSVPLLVVPGSLVQAVVQAFLISVPAMREILTQGGADRVIDFYPRGYDLALFAYLPSVVMVLMRPNERPS